MSTALRYRWWRFSVGAVCAGATVAFAGPEWEEPTGDDAGALPADAQIPFGPAAQLTKITGSLDGNARSGPGGDYQDVYLIYVFAPTIFDAQTTLNGLNPTDFNTQLWLFSGGGFAQLANDDESAFSAGRSRVTAVADDGSGFALTSAGYYYLGISGFNSDPESSSGDLLFDQASAIEVSGPDGPGSAPPPDPVAQWSGNGETGDYVIELMGVAFVATCPGDVDGNNMVDVNDITYLIPLLGTSGTPGTVDGDADLNGVVDVNDITFIIPLLGTMC